MQGSNPTVIARRREGGPSLGEEHGPPLPRSMRARGVQVLEDLHSGQGILYGREQYRSTFGAPGNEVTDGDMRDFDTYMQQLADSPPAIFERQLREWRDGDRPESKELQVRRLQAEQARHRATNPTRICRVGWCRTRERDGALVFETWQAGATVKEMNELTREEALEAARRDQTRLTFSVSERVDEMNRWLDEAMSQRREFRSFNEFLDFKFGGKEGGDIFRARMNAHPLTAGTPEALISAVDLFKKREH